MKLRNPSIKEKDYYPSGLIVNHTFVCRKCNSTGRKPSICPKCHIPRLSVGKRAKIPKKNDAKGWKQFWIWYDNRTPTQKIDDACSAQH